METLNKYCKLKAIFFKPHDFIGKRIRFNIRLQLTMPIKGQHLHLIYDLYQRSDTIRRHPPLRCKTGCHFVISQTEIQNTDRPNELQSISRSQIARHSKQTRQTRETQPRLVDGGGGAAVAAAEVVAGTALSSQQPRRRSSYPCPITTNKNGAVGEGDTTIDSVACASLSV